MKLVKHLLAAGAVMLVSFSAQAEFFQCYGVKIEEVAVEGARDDGFGFADHMVIKLNQKCGGQDWVHRPMSDPLMEHFLVVALAAKTSNAEVKVGVNTVPFLKAKQNEQWGANQLAYISLVE